MRNFLFLSLLLIWQPTVLMAKSYDALVLSSSQVVEVKNDVLHTYYSYVLQINNRSGEDYTTISIPFSSMVELMDLEAVIKDASGEVVRKLKKSDIVIRSAISSISFYEDDFIKEFTLKHNSYPYTIEYAYQTRQKEFLELARWSPVLYNGIPTMHSHLSLTIPENYDIKYYQQHCDSAVVSLTPDGEKYVWESSCQKLISSESLMPEWFNFMPYVNVVPVNFEYDKQGSFESWESLGEWQSVLLEGLDVLTPSEKVRIDQLVEGLEDEKEKVRVLYHYLQDETRYVNVTIETGGLKPYPATYVCRNKYGDCKALSNYFKAVLKHVGIDSHYVKVNAGSPTYHVIRDHPSQQFNHIILFVPLPNDSLWLDCTSDNAFNYLGTFTQDRDALLVEHGKSRLVRTPALSSNQVLDQRHITVKYQQANVAEVDYKCLLRGDDYSALSYVKSSYNKQEKDRVVKNYFNEDGYTINDYDIISYDRDSAFVGFDFSAINQSIYENYGDDVVIKNIALDLPFLENVSKRKQDLQIDFPIYKVDTVYYELPSFYNYTGKPTPFTVDSNYGRYSIEIKEEGGQLLVVKSFELHRGYYPLSNYEDFYAFWKKVISLDKMKILLTK